MVTPRHPLRAPTRLRLRAESRVAAPSRAADQAEVALSQDGGYGSGGGCSTITSGRMSELDAQGTTVRSMNVQLFGLSVDTALSPNGKWLAVASPGAYARAQGTLQVYATTGMQAIETLGVCQAPSHSSGEENQTTGVVFDDNNVLYSFSRDPAELQIFAEPQLPMGPDASLAALGGVSARARASRCPACSASLCVPPTCTAAVPRSWKSASSQSAEAAISTASRRI